MTNVTHGAADGRILPFLYIRDWEAARRFYEGILQFAWEPVTDGWVMVRSGAGTVCALIAEATRHETTPPHRAGVFIMVPGQLEARLAAMTAQGVSVVRPLRRFSHGAEAAIADPDGNVLVLYETTVGTTF
jgi:predicted enzyme related to lactoylglutathione lyase